jgi:hypothetical protein
MTGLYSGRLGRCWKGESLLWVWELLKGLFQHYDKIINIYFALQENHQIPFSVHEVQSQTHESKMDPKLCPCNSNLAAFVHRNDIWVANLETGQELRLTHANNGSTNSIEEPVSAGVASFVVQEEFDRYTGYWWQPKCVIDESKF